MIRGIKVELKIAPGNLSKTFETLYLGVYGKHGGREFALDVAGINELSTPDQVVFLKLGQGCCSNDSDLEVSGGPCNTPINYPLELGDIEYVYLRKMQTTRRIKSKTETTYRDDSLRLSYAKVLLCDAHGNNRKFAQDHAMSFSFNCGEQHWLEEKPREGCRIVVELESIRYGGQFIGNNVSYDLDLTIAGIGSRTIADQIKPFRRRTTRFIGRQRAIFIPGCCGTEYRLDLKAAIEERDPGQNDHGDEEADLVVTCSNERTEYPFEIKVDVPAQYGRVGEFTFKGKVITTCVS